MRLVSDFLEVDVYPEHGYAITSISPTSTRRNILWNPPHSQPGILPSSELGPSGEASINTFDRGVLVGGWFLMFPLAGLPGTYEKLWMHGEAARLSWEIVSQSVDEVVCRLITPISQFELVRTVKVTASVVFITTLATNLSESTQEISFGEHPCFSRKEFAGSQLLAAPQSARVTSLADPLNATLKENAEFAWPFAPLHRGGTENLSEIPTKADGRHDHINLLGLNKVQILGGNTELSLSWDSEFMSDALLWQHFLPFGSPWPGDVFAIEPTSAPGRTYSEAESTNSLVRVAPGSCISTWTSLQVHSK